MADRELELLVSRGRLQEIADTYVEIPDKTLFDAIQEVLQVRGGDRWKDLDEIGLDTKSGVDVFIGWREKTAEFPWDTTNMETGDDKARHSYEVRHEEGQSEVYVLYEIIDLDTREGEAVGNFGNLAPARLLSILADAHTNTPLEELSENTEGAGERS